MFVALRDLRFARGRFILIGAVVALITILVGFLAGLTGGLANQNISAVLGMPGDRVVFAPPASADGSPTFADSDVSAAQAQQWRDAPGVTEVEPIGISQTRLETADARTSIALFGVEPTYADTAPVDSGKITLAKPAADELGVAVGEVVTVGGHEFTVEAIGGDWWYSHTAVAQITLEDWQAFASATGSPDAYATVLAVSGSPDWATTDAAVGTVSEGTVGTLMALSSFKSEIGSLLLMVAMLFGISGLVIGAFFTVWTMQRRGDVAVLKALGASTRSLVRDSLGQALIVLIVGIGAGTLIVFGLGTLAAQALPFVLSPLTTLLPGLIMTTLGLGGAAFALRSVTTADPLTALGSNR
ncbi:ABC transporter permease [Gulosibacter molinativorax]|uniref:ABC transporter permease n=1 Tax=Gulosibacter molinativorax TaxID=256821 RepID=A0ABT7CAM1_9MICO|nr:ABC transporter permease [Gulosibacter molinativorax]MDJ1372243.1 ABC transporter permease [Gulosibacter molinativorax]QUY63474.1 Putative ABC transport system transmembrane protein [Gulosibacter molinativorax]